jgi:phosphocarrier protein HPr
VSLALVMSTSPVTRTVVIVNPQGLHARPAEQFVRTAMKFQSRVVVVCRNERLDGKSILELLTMGGTQGTELMIEADGSDAEQAVDVLAKFVERGFDEMPGADENSPETQSGT